MIAFFRDVKVFKTNNYFIESLESAKLRALRAHVQTCHACLHAHVPM